ncbi:MAG: BT4734/BF3469 family protein [Maribacter arcticus]|uniref:BT4734/BF3469 family protein n=1 Tax=Maribacter arcticus TaxID=561365 RepID=UPI0030018108
MNLINPLFIVSYYNNLFSTKEPDNEFDINQLIETIKYGYLKNIIENLRLQTDKQEKNKIKQALIPCVTLSGIFSERNSKGFLEHSGLIQIDIDDISSYNDVFNNICKDEFTYVAFRSPSGNGIKIIVKINPSIETHLEQFYALQRYYLENYAIEIDPACKDISRCMLLSYDPKLYCNPFANVFPELYLPEHLTQRQESQTYNHTFNIDSGSDFEKIAQITAQIESQGIDITTSYENWLRIGFCVSSIMNEAGRDYFHRISKFYQGYKPNECDKLYNAVLSRNNGAVGLGTLIFVAREHGIDINFSNNSFLSNVPSEKNKNDTSIIYNKSDSSIAQKYTLPSKSDTDKELKAKLSEFRLKVAREEGLRAFRVFSNASLEELITLKPSSREELLKVKGIAEMKFDWFGKQLLSLIHEHLQLVG